MRTVLAAALLALCATPVLATPAVQKAPILSPADTDRDGVVSRDEAADWLAKGQGSIVPIRSDPAVRAQAPRFRTMFDQGLLRPNDFRAPPPEDRPPEDLFYKDFRKIEK